MPETAKRTARVPILGENGRISDDYIPAAIGENVTKAESAATRAETAATSAEDSASAASTSAAQASGSASAASASATQAQQSATTAGGAATSAQSAQTAAEAAQSAAAGSAQDAQQSATAAAESAASVANKFISSAQATTLDPGSPATASVADQVLTIGVPKGDKGDKGEKGDPGTGVPDGGTPGQLLSKTEDGTAWVDPPSTGNVLTGEVEGYVAHAEDAYAQKPIEVRVKGRTVKNLWPYKASSESAGINATMDKTGLITLTGTASTNVYVPIGNALGAAANKSYTLAVSNLPSGVAVLADSYNSENTWLSSISVQSGTTATGTTSANMAELRCMIKVANGTIVNASFRVMLVEGDTAPDCFTPPASITSVQTGNLVTAGKNLLETPSSGTAGVGITTVKHDDGSVTFDGTATNTFWFYATALDFYLPSGTYTLSGFDEWPESLRQNVRIESLYKPQGSNVGVPMSLISPTGTVKDGGPHYFRFVISVPAGAKLDNVTVYPQLELGSTATAYEPPNVTTTPLPEVELRSLPNGTADELVIAQDGTATVERRTQLSGGEVTALPEPTTEKLSAVSLPKLPAQTFNAYHDSNVPSDTTVTYERDINIAFEQLAKQVAGTASAVAVREASTIEEE